MSMPDIVRFSDRLAEAQRDALAKGEMSRRDFDALLMDPEFEDEAFERFRARLLAAGVRLPEDDTEEIAFQLDPRQLAKEPERDLLGFVMCHARLLADWQRDVIGIVREETGYFVPQLRTKVLNEGFATWTHNRVVQALGLDSDDFLEFNRLNAAVARPHADHPNPYHLGWIVLREIERIAADPTDEECERWPWAGEGEEAGVQRILEVVEGYDDVALLAEFVTPRVCELAQLFAWERTAGGPDRIVVTSREADEVRHRLLALHANAGLPVVEIVDADGLGQGQLFLEHRHEGVGLDDEYARGTLRHLASLWGKPVVVRTIERREQTPVWLVAHPGRRDVERTRVEQTRAA